MDSEYNNIYFYPSESEYTTIEMLVSIERQDLGIEAEVPCRFLYNTLSRQINLGRSLNELPLHAYISSQACQVFYLDEYLKCYVYLGNYPFDKDVIVSSEDFVMGTIRLRYRPIIPEYIQQEALVEFQVRDDQPKQDLSKKRAKERTIREVLMQVSKWRQLAQKDKCTLDVASKLMGLSKKTLDDYYSQVKMGEAYHFDFESHLNDGIGVLRKFVKEKKEKTQKPSLKILEKYQDFKKEEDYEKP